MEIVYAMLAGFVLDSLLGDPRWLPHPVVAIGKMIAGLEGILRRNFPARPRTELIAGGLLVVIVGTTVFGVAWAVLYCAYRLHPWAGWLVECALCYQVLAAKCLRDAALAVRRPLLAGDVAGAREAVGHIVGRDTAGLGVDAVARAAVETVAENSSDGVIAPLLYFALGGAPLALLYKAVNTMDSMIGYKNDRYRYFGRAAARLDDAANYLPARLTALLMVPAARLAGLNWRGAFRIWRRDRRNHSSPNAGHPEAACAGALGVRLGGDSVYGGKVVAKPTIGDPERGIEPDDIARACRLLFWTAWLGVLLCGGGRLLCLAMTEGAGPWN